MNKKPPVWILPKNIQFIRGLEKLLLDKEIIDSIGPKPLTPLTFEYQEYAHHIDSIEKDKIEWNIIKTDEYKSYIACVHYGVYCLNNRDDIKSLRELSKDYLITN